MKRTHSVFVDVSEAEVLAIRHAAFKRKGWLKGIPNNVYPAVFDNFTEISLEYNWEEKNDTIMG